MERIATLFGLVLGAIGRLLLPLAPALVSQGAIVLFSFASLLTTTLLLVVLVKFLRARVELPFSIGAAILWRRLNEPNYSLAIRACVGAVLMLELLLISFAASVAGFFATHALLKH